MFTGFISNGEVAHTVTSKPSGTVNKSAGTSGGPSAIFTAAAGFSLNTENRTFASLGLPARIIPPSSIATRAENRTAPSGRSNSITDGACAPNPFSYTFPSTISAPPA